MSQEKKQAITEVVNNLQISNGVKSIFAIPSGFQKFDEFTGGWQRSEVVIIGSRPTMGKTSFALSTAANIAIRDNTPTAFFSLEMSTEKLIRRILMSESELSSEQLSSGHLSDLQWKRFNDKAESIQKAPLFIDDTAGSTIMEIYEECKRLKDEYEIEAVFIDYLQLINGGVHKTINNKEQEISFIMKTLKEIAKKLNVAVIVLSQLSRAVETRGGDKRPEIRDLRDSGSIEQDSDMVMFLYRPECYDIMENEDGNSTRGLVDLTIAKNRNGTLNQFLFKFETEFSKFRDWKDEDWKSLYGGNDEGTMFDGYDDDEGMMFDGYGDNDEIITLGCKINNRNDNIPPPENPPF